MNLSNYQFGIIDNYEFTCGSSGTYYNFSTMARIDKESYALLLGQKNKGIIFKISLNFDSDTSQKGLMERKLTSTKHTDSFVNMELRDKVDATSNNSARISEDPSSIPIFDLRKTSGPIQKYSADVSEVEERFKHRSNTPKNKSFSRKSVASGAWAESIKLARQQTRKSAFTNQAEEVSGKGLNFNSEKQSKVDPSQSDKSVMTPAKSLGNEMLRPGSTISEAHQIIKLPSKRRLTEGMKKSDQEAPLIEATFEDHNMEMELDDSISQDHEEIVYEKRREEDLDPPSDFAGPIENAHQLALQPKPTHDVKENISSNLSSEMRLRLNMAEENFKGSGIPQENSAPNSIPGLNLEPPSPGLRNQETSSGRARPSSFKKTSSGTKPTRISDTEEKA